MTLCPAANIWAGSLAVLLVAGGDAKHRLLGSAPREINFLIPGISSFMSWRGPCPAAEHGSTPGCGARCCPGPGGGSAPPRCPPCHCSSSETDFGGHQGCPGACCLCVPGSASRPAASVLRVSSWCLVTRGWQGHSQTQHTGATAQHSQHGFVTLQ